MFVSFELIYLIKLPGFFLFCLLLKFIKKEELGKIKKAV